MGKRWILAAALMVLSSTAFAEHAFTLEPDAAPAAVPPASPAVASESAATAPTTAPAPTVAPAPDSVRQAQAAYPAAVDVYLVPAAMREVCTVGEWGFDEIRTDCRTEPIPARRADPALRGLCVTRYGQRSCY